jgi:hypothetical protein
LWNGEQINLNKVGQLQKQSLAAIWGFENVLQNKTKMEMLLFQCIQLYNVIALQVLVLGFDSGFNLFKLAVIQVG